MIKGVGTVVLLLLAGTAYFLYPYWTLLSLQQALKDKNTATLEALIDWPQVRSSLKSDLRSILTAPRPGKSDADTAGAALGTMLGAAYIDAMIDGQISANNLVSKIQPESPFIVDARDRGFLTPTSFFVDFMIPNVARGTFREHKVIILMQFSGLSWRVNRLIVPPDIIAEGIQSRRP